MSVRLDRRSALVSPRPQIFREDLPDSFGRYHDLIGASGATSARTGETFEARVAAYNLPDLMLFDRQVAGIEHRRGTDQIRRDGFEHFYFQVLRSGTLAGGVPGGERWLASGDVLLLDAAQPQRTVVTAADYVTVVLPRPLVEAAVPDMGRFHGHVLPQAASHRIGKAVLSLVRGVAGLDAGEAIEAGRMIADLLAEGVGSAVARDDDRRRLADRLRAGLFIDANIAWSGLGVGAVATGVGISRSSLYRAFEPLGGIEREIGRRRIARFRSALLRPDEGQSMERLAAALGFSSFSHCSRMFKATYGSTPGECRAELRGLQKASGPGLHLDHLREWYRSLGEQAFEA